MINYETVEVQNRRFCYLGQKHSFFCLCFLSLCHAEHLPVSSPGDACRMYVHLLADIELLSNCLNIRILSSYTCILYHNPEQIHDHVALRLFHGSPEGTKQTLAIKRVFCLVSNQTQQGRVRWGPFTPLHSMDKPLDASKSCAMDLKCTWEDPGLSRFLLSVSDVCLFSLNKTSLYGTSPLSTQCCLNNGERRSSDTWIKLFLEPFTKTVSYFSSSFRSATLLTHFSLNASSWYWLMLWQEQALNINQAMLPSLCHCVGLSKATWRFKGHNAPRMTRVALIGPDVEHSPGDTLNEPRTVWRSAALHWQT